MELVTDAIVTIISVAVVAAYIWSGFGHFSSDKPTAGAMLISVAVIVSTLLLLWLTWTVSQPLWAQLLGAVLELAAAALFIAAIIASRQAKLNFVFDPVHPHGLVAIGPYRFVRHPFYVSYVIFWSGWALATWSWFAPISPIVLCWLYVIAARFEERNFAASPLAADYAAYRRRVGFFWPKPPLSRDPG